MRDRSQLSWGTDLVACEFTFGLEPILQITAEFFTAFEINFICATLDFLLTCRGSLPNVLLSRHLWKVAWTAYLSWLSMTCLLDFLFPDQLRPQIVPTFSEERGADAFRS